MVVYINDLEELTKLMLKVPCKNTFFNVKHMTTVSTIFSLYPKFYVCIENNQFEILVDSDYFITFDEWHLLHSMGHNG